MDLNESQRAAVEYGIGGGRPSPPLLIIAGAGTGKTKTLAHRVAHLVLNGTDPQRILLLTFTRRAAAEMTRRAARILGEARRTSHAIGTGVPAYDIGWSGTFHAIANRLLRFHAHGIGMDPSFTVLDRSDSADLMNLVRNDLGLSKKATRFPKKDTCLAIYSHAVNACCELAGTLVTAFPWCADWPDELKELFRAYVIAKQRNNVLDYDDLLLYWRHMMEEPALAAEVGARFDHVLVDEYQDTNALQAAILLRMKPDGRGLTVVGDDAQSIYSFRAATVRNILDFPKHFSPPATVVTLEQNYRSTQPILDASNAVIGLAPERYSKRLFSTKLSGEKPQFISAADEPAQVQYVVERILEHREAGIDLKRQAVLFRAAHHSAALEVELARRNIPFVKYGGLKFLEAAHVKDVLCVLRWAENPRDAVAGFRVLQLLPGRRTSRSKERACAALRMPLHIQSAEWRQRPIRSGAALECVLRHDGPASRFGNSMDWTGGPSSASGTSRILRGFTITRRPVSAIWKSWSRSPQGMQRVSVFSRSSRSTLRRPPAPKPGHRCSMKTTSFCRPSIPPRDRNGTRCSF